MDENQQLPALKSKCQEQKTALTQKAVAAKSAKNYHCWYYQPSKKKEMLYSGRKEGIDMPRYQTAHPVNWRRILRCVQKRIELDKYLFEELLKWKEKITGQEYSCRELQKNLEAYRALRKFLGYSSPTKLEKEIAELLKAPLPNPDEKRESGKGI